MKPTNLFKKKQNQYCIITKNTQIIRLLPDVIILLIMLYLLLSKKNLVIQLNICIFAKKRDICGNNT